VDHDEVSVLHRQAWFVREFGANLADDAAQGIVSIGHRRIVLNHLVAPEPLNFREIPVDKGGVHVSRHECLVVFVMFFHLEYLHE
jgi:hypothetical protein